MLVKEREVESIIDMPRNSSPAGDGGAADRSRQVSAFVSAGRSAIERALSGNSQKFLQQNQQRGGE